MEPAPRAVTRLAAARERAGATVPHANLRRLLGLRAISALALAAATLVMHYALAISLPLGAIGVTLAGWAALTLASVPRLREGVALGDGELTAQLLLDVIAMSIVLYLSGGPANPLVSLLLLPLTVAATLLALAHAWALAAIGAAAYTALMFYHRPLPHVHGGVDEFDLHLMGMWITFVLSAGIVAGFVVTMAASLRERDRRLAKAREETLRNERIVALGTLAAGAAHELGTPLATIAVVSKELEREFAQRPSASEDLRALRDQVEHCKRVISDLLRSAGDGRLESLRRERADALLAQTCDKWRLLRPQAHAVCRTPNTSPAPMIAADTTLAQAITNLLNNAADASPQGIEVELAWDSREVRIDILDRGPGLGRDTLAKLGQVAFSTKPRHEGAGVGAFLANATVERFGGRVEVENRAGGGARTRVVLPIVPGA